MVGYQTAIVAVAALSTALGLYIGYQAYRGFRRNDSRPMQLLSVGLILLTAVTYTTAFVATLLLRRGFLPLALEQPVTLVTRVFQLVGLLLIAYSLYRRP